MAFKPIANFQHNLVRMACANSTTIVKGNALVDDTNGYLTNATAGNGLAIEYVAMESVVTTSAGQLVLCCRVRGVTFEADTDANPAQTDVGNYADLITDAGTVDPDASTDDLFYIESIKGAVGDKKVIGFFNPNTPSVE